MLLARHRYRVTGIVVASKKVIQFRQPAARIYAMACGHRPVFFGPHNQDPRAVAALDFGPTRTLRNEVSLSY
jgi:hypothetical protein